MANLADGFPIVDHDRIFRAVDPRIPGFAPGVAAPVQSGNQTLEKVALSLNGAGTLPGNPILAGLAMRVDIPLGSGDSLTGLFIFTDRADPKGNLVDQVSGGPAGLVTFDMPIVEGNISVGSPATGAIRNYIRQESLSGIMERTFWVQSKDFNAVQLNSLPALDPITLAPVPITVKRPNTVDPFIDVAVDFFVAWSDEFHVKHRSNNLNLTPGFSKSYGGAAWVSVFDTNPTPAQEGVGTEVSPYTNVNISNQKKVQVENSVGLKRGTFRFRANSGSPYFVDCPFEVNVIEDTPPVCDPPTTSNPPPPDDPPPCVDPPVDYIPPLDPPSTTPVDTVWSDPGGGLSLVPYSLEGVTPEQGVVTEFLKEPQLTITVQSQSTGGSPLVHVRRYTFMGDAAAHDSIKTVLVDEKIFIPLVVSGATCPTNDPPYNTAEALRVAFSVSQELAAGIIWYEVFVVDGGLSSKASSMFGPAIANLSAFMQPGTGKTAPTAPT